MVSVYESHEGPTIRQESVDYPYTIEGTESEFTARVALLAESATSVIVGGATLVRKDAQISLHDQAVDVWDGRVIYGERDRPDTNDSEFHFDTGGGSHHITHSISHTAYGPNGGAAPDCKGAIGWDGDRVAGIDVSVPSYSFSETHYLSVDVVTEAYRMTVADMTARTNAAAFRGHAAGEILFCGAAGSQRGEEDWAVTFKFAFSPNKTNIEVSDITVASKKGWEYLDIRYRPADDQAAQAMIPDPIGAYVHKVYYDGDFSQLGLG